ncbi:MAG: signal peptide peptidase SppA [Sulfurovaceae bacterium]
MLIKFIYKESSVFSFLSSAIKWISERFWGMVFILIVFMLILPKSDNIGAANLQEIELKGTIMDATRIVEDIYSAKNDSAIKGVLLNIDSPGGAVAPSVEISYAIKSLSEKKPVVVYASGTMASGGYYSAIYGNEIIANPGSLVGSIGVIMQGVNVEGLLETIGVKPQIVKEGKYKEIGTPMREWKDFERVELESITKETYDMFVNDVAKARKLDVANASVYADAHIFTAAKAKEVGLIDAVGTREDAKNRLMKLSGVKNPLWRQKDRVEQFFEKLQQNMASQVIAYISGPKASL